MQPNVSLVSLLSVPLAGLLALQIPAQTPPVRIYNADNNASTGGANAIPFGLTGGLNATWSNQKYQTIVPSSQFGKKLGQICSLGFANGAAGYRQFDTIEVKMDYFPGTGSTLTTTFSNNITSNAKTVLSAKNYVWHATKDRWVHIGLQKTLNSH